MTSILKSIDISKKFDGNRQLVQEGAMAPKNDQVGFGLALAKRLANAKITETGPKPVTAYPGMMG